MEGIFVALPIIGLACLVGGLCIKVDMAEAERELNSKCRKTIK